MGWSHCGTDSRGRPIGYAHQATCDHPGCTTAIDRGLTYACGGMHGAGAHDCEGYFCEVHLRLTATSAGSVALCAECARATAGAGEVGP